MGGGVGGEGSLLPSTLLVGYHARMTQVTSSIAGGTTIVEVNAMLAQVRLEQR